MPFSQLPLCSSRQLIAAIERLGAFPGKKTSGSHASYHRQTENGILTATVVLGKREIPRSVVRSILKQLQISVEDFVGALR